MWVIVDGNNLLHRALKVPNVYELTNGGKYVFLRAMKSITRKHNVERFVVVWDGGLSERRLELYPAYKQERLESHKSNEETGYNSRVKAERASLLEAFEELPFVTSIQITGWEADDVIAHIATIELPDDTTALIHSSDKDFIQLVNGRVEVLRPLGKKESHITLENYRNHLPFTPGFMAYELSILGDSCDGITGIPGIGEKTARAVATLYCNHCAEECEPHSLAGLEEYILTHEPEIGKKQKSLAAGLDIVRRNYELVKLPVTISGPVADVAHHQLYEKERRSEALWQERFK